MEPIHGIHKASKLVPEDLISSMPDNVITNILDRLPLQDAVRTDVLSRTWRFKWTMLSQLVFGENFFEKLENARGKKNHVRIITRFLLHLRGAITKFVLSADNYSRPISDDDVSDWILFLSRKGIEDLTLEKLNERPFKLPTYLFSCLELKHLKLCDFRFNPPPTFHGFPNPLSLELSMQFEENNELGKFITQSPLLEILKLDDVQLKPDDVQLLVIAKLENLKIFSISNCDVDTNVFDFLCSFTKLHELELDFQVCKLKEGGAKMSFPTVKVLKLTNICLDNGMTSSCAFQLISSFPNLHTLEITVNDLYGTHPPPQVATMGPLQLRSARFTNLKGSENEICFIKYLPACSPLLKKIAICPLKYLGHNKHLMFFTRLLKLQRAFPIVDISVY